jgi:hypothetical protein
MGQVGNFHLSDLSFIGTGPEFIYMVSSLIDNVQVTASRRGLQFINNCYLNRLTSVRVIGHETTQFGLGLGPQSGVLTMTDISLSGSHFPFYIDTGSGVLDGLWIEQTNGTEIGAVLKGNINDTIVLSNPLISAETAPMTLRYPVVAVGMGSVVMNTSVIETYNHATHVGVFGGGSIIHTAGNYSSGMAPASVFQIVTPPQYPVQLMSPVQQNIPLVRQHELGSDVVGEVESKLHWFGQSEWDQQLGSTGMFGRSEFIWLRADGYQHCAECAIEQFDLLSWR